MKKRLLSIVLVLTCLLAVCPLQVSATASDHSHLYNTREIQPVSCTEPGFVTHFCACGDSYVSDYQEALGHQWGEWRVAAQPTEQIAGSERRMCSRCYEFEYRELPVLEHVHSYTAAYTAVTCVRDGYTTYTCRCGDSYVTDYQEALGHNWSEWERVQDPSELVAGWDQRVCANCNQSETREVSALGHTHEHTAAVTPPTCTEDGYITYTCRCGDSYVGKIIDALGHNWGEWHYSTAPTQTEEGEIIFTCTACPATKAETVPPLGSAAEQVPASSNNEGAYNYGVIAAGLIHSSLILEGDGYLRVEAIGRVLTVEKYDKDGTFLSRRDIPVEIGGIGGVYIGEDYNFVVFGQLNLQEDNSLEVIRIVRYSKNWDRLDSVGLSAIDVYIPFQFGSLRFARSGDTLYIRTCREMYDHGDGKHHQSNITICLDIPTMTAYDSEFGYVSHSFNQFILTEGNDVIALDQGDASPRAVVMHRYSTATSDYGSVHVLDIADSTDHYNYTGVALGGFEYSDSHYLVAGNSASQEGGISFINNQRNIFIAATPKDDFTAEATNILWLTDYAEGDGVTLSPPQMVKLDDGRFFLMWTANKALHYCFITADGQLDGGIRETTGYLSDCMPIQDGSRIIWYVTIRSTPVFYTVDLTDPGEVELLHTHSFSAGPVTPPTCTEQGFTTYVCQCGNRYVTGYTEPTGHSWGAWEIVKEATETQGGEAQRVCSACGETETRETAPLSHTHSHSAAVTPPTCTEQGYTTHTCPCGDSYTDSYTAATGHRWSAWEVTEPATATHGGVELRECTQCYQVETRDTPSLSAKTFTDVFETDWYYSSVYWAVDEGVTSGTGDGTTFSPLMDCSRAQVVTFLWRAVGSPEVTGENPFIDVDEGAWYYNAVLWAVENGITTGTGADTFSPDMACSRAQVVTFLYRTAGSPNPMGNNPFTDVSKDAWYYDAVLWAVGREVTSGTTPTTFAPDMICSRSQVVTFLYRANI